MHAWQTAMLGAALAVASGCTQRAERYTPEPALARKSLTAALEAWRAGHPADALAGQPSIQLVDTSRKPGQRLQSFDILSEQATGAQGRSFVVRLSLDDPAAEARVRYVVVGIDPIWIFHKDDYDRLAHWEHPMEPNEPVETSASGGDLVPQQTTPLETAPPAGSAQLPAGSHARY
jgi:hypothetical protein